MMWRLQKLVEVKLVNVCFPVIKNCLRLVLPLSRGTGGHLRHKVLVELPLELAANNCYRWCGQRWWFWFTFADFLVLPDIAKHFTTVPAEIISWAWKFWPSSLARVTSRIFFSVILWDWKCWPSSYARVTSRYFTCNPCQKWWCWILQPEHLLPHACSSCVFWHIFCRQIVYHKLGTELYSELLSWHLFYWSVFSFLEAEK